MRKISAFLLSFTLMVLMIPSTLAVSDHYQESKTVYTQAGDVEIVITTVIYSSAARSSQVRANQIATAKYGGKVIGEVTLSVTFGYDGKTAWVSSTSSSHNTYDGWSYGNEKITESGSSVSLTGKFTKLLYNPIVVNPSLTCSPTGQIS